MNTEELARDLRERMRSDVINTLRQHFGPEAYITSTLVDALVDDGMFPVEHLLAQIDQQEYTA